MSVDRDGLLKAFPIGAMKVNGFDIGTSLREIFAEQSELAALRKENRLLNHDIASFLETTAKVCKLLGIDTDDAKHAEGKPSDVLFSHATGLQQRLTAAEQQYAKLVEEVIALPDEFKSLSGSENTAGVYACIDYISEWAAKLAQPTESGASE